MLQGLAADSRPDGFQQLHIRCAAAQHFSQLYAFLAGQTGPQETGGRQPHPVAAGAERLFAVHRADKAHTARPAGVCVIYRRPVPKSGALRRGQAVQPGIILPQLLQDLAVGDAQFLQFPGAAHGHQLQKPQPDGEKPDIPPDEPAVVLLIIAPQRHIVELERDAAEHGILKSLLHGGVLRRRKAGDALVPCIAQAVQAQIDANDQYERMKVRIKYMYESGNTQFVAVLAESKNMGDFLNKAEYISQISEYDRDELIRYQDTVEEIEVKEEEVQAEYEELNTLQTKLVGQQTEVQKMIDENKEKLSNIQSEIDANAAACLLYTSDAADE